MIYIKSIIVGAIAVILAALSLGIALLLYYGSDVAIGWNPRGLRSVPFLLVVAFIFSLGYSWQYRRLSRRISN